MIEINVNNETSELVTVVLGIPNNFGNTPNLESCYDPKSKQHVKNGTFPSQEDITYEMNYFLDILTKYNIDVLRPKDIKGLNQIFSRDIAFVIENKLFIPNIIQQRKKEIQAIDHIINEIDSSNVIMMPEDTRMEGGDVILFNNYIFIGYSKKDDFEKYDVARTNKQGASFLLSHFPDKQILSFELVKSDTDPRENALHLDCCFQPIGNEMAIMYKEGFKHLDDVNFLVNLFSEEKIIFITKEEMYDMNSNIFSISDNVVVSEVRFTRLNHELRDRGFVVEEIKYSEIGKMEGLFRCSTLPLYRR